MDGIVRRMLALRLACAVLTGAIAPAMAASAVDADTGAAPHERANVAPRASVPGKAAANAARPAASGATAARSDARKTVRQGTRRRPASHESTAHASSPPPLSYSDEFERAELIEEMLKECRGVAYNAYELVQSTGEALWQPAPIQLVTVRVRHPYCATLLRAYAPRAGA
jgi:hypothetical protein